MKRSISHQCPICKREFPLNDLVVEENWTYCPNCEQDIPAPLIVTRHQVLIQYLIDQDLIPDRLVKAHGYITHVVDSAQIVGRHVIGVLPMRLAAQAARITEIPLDVPAEFRGRELSPADVERFAAPPRTYEVREIVPQE